MADQPRGMGRGLSAILPRGTGTEEDGLRELALEVVEPNPVQPRRSFDPEALTALAESIRSRGVLQPVVVRPRPGGTYQLIAGERRLRAAREAGLERIPAVVRDSDDRERLELALAENMAREDLNAIEEARACALLVEDLELSKEELGRRVGRSRAAISNLIRLLELPEDVLELIEAGDLSEGHGRALLTCKDHERRRRLAKQAIAESWSVRETERRARETEDHPRRAPVVVHPDLAEALAAAEDVLQAALGREVTLRPIRGHYRAELKFESPSEAMAFAEATLRTNQRQAA